MQRKFTLTVGGVPHSVTAEGSTISVDGRSFTVEVTDEGRVLVDGIAYEVVLSSDTATVDGQSYPVQINGLHLMPPAASPPDPALPQKVLSAAMPGPRTGAGTVAAIMPGKIIRVLVREGQSVEAGQPVCILEAMKMENELRAHCRGTVRAVYVKAGDDVEKGQALVEIE